MGNYSLVINSKFNPFSYQEMLAPVLMATQAHQELENQYGELDTKASIWDNLADEQTDPNAYKMYKTFANDLRNKRDQLEREGLNIASRRDMLNMKARYSSDIVPIETAYKRREELAAEQRKALAANPTLRYQRMANQMSLDDFIRNPSLDYGESYSGALLTQQVSQAVANFQRALTDKGQLRKLGLPYQYERMIQYGATPAQVMAAMSENAQQGDTDAIRFLRGVTDQVLQSSGVTDWADPATLREFRAFANQGLYSAIGQIKLDNFTDQAGLTQLKADLDDRNNRRAETRRAERGAAAADEALRRAIKLSGISYLSASGDLAKYERALSGLKAGQQAVKASIFGKNGKVNPIVVYDKAQIAMKQAENKIRRQYDSKIRNAQRMADNELGGNGYYSDQVSNIQSKMASAIAAARKEAYKNTLQEYGVTQGITADQYTALKAIGYKGGQTLSYSQLLNPLNTLAEQMTYYSTNMSGYDNPDKKIRAQLGNWENNDSFSTRVYKLNPNGTQGAAVSHEDLNLYNESNTSGRKVTGIYYSAFTPGKIIVQIGESGDRYLMDPNVLGSEVAALIGQTSNIIKSDPNVDLTQASVATTTALSRLLNSYNPTASTSSNNAGE